MNKDAVRRHVDEVLGGPLGEDGGETHYLCPFCRERRPAGETGRLHVNYEKNMCLCHRCQWASRDLLNIVRAITGSVPKRLLRRSLRNFYDEVKSLMDDVQAGKKVRVRLPKHFTPIVVNDRNRYGRAMYSYLRSRGITDAQMESCGIGYCGDGEFEGRIVFPVYVMGSLTFWTTRIVLGGGKKVLSADDGREVSVFNYDRCAGKKTVIVGEGPFDALAFERAGYGGCATFGTFVNDSQMRLLGKLPCDELVLCFDEDAIAVAAKTAEKMARVVPQLVSYVRWRGPDADEVSKGRVKTRIRNRVNLDLEGRIRLMLGEKKGGRK